MRDYTRRVFLWQSGAAGLAARASARAGDNQAENNQPATNQVDNNLIARVWSAQWISPPGAPPNSYGVYHFRRTWNLAALPHRFVVHVSADNRYQLFVNGTRVSSGPARGDLFHWRYETLDVAAHLNTGRNVLAAVVWNFGEAAPEAQITLRTGFVLRGDGAAERVA